MKPQKRVRGGKVRWVARYRGSDGLERSRTFARERDAKDWVGDRERELRRGEWIDPAAQEVTVGQLWATWESMARTDGTRKVRELVGRNLGRLENVPIGKLRKSDVREWVVTLRSGRTWVKGCDGLGENTVASWSGQFAGCMNLAVSDGLLLKSPAAGVSGRRRREHQVTRAELLTADQVWQLVESAAAGREGGRDWIAPQPTLARMITVCAATGLRAGEVAGLRIRSVDFLRRELVVVEQSKTGTSRFEWAPLKSPASRRTIPLPVVAVDALAEELAERPCADRSMPVFRTATGSMWSSSTVGKSFQALRERCALPEEVTWHGLRHFYASTLIHSGESVKVVQERLGHASADTTLETYVHLWPGSDERTRAAVDDALSRTVRDRCGTEGGEAVSGGEEAPAAGEVRRGLRGAKYRS